MIRRSFNIGQSEKGRIFRRKTCRLPDKFLSLSMVNKGDEIKPAGDEDG
ncbi:hypothetical protein GW590_07345 [Rahnella sp. SAP-1]|uniref:Uncharacterized protein n=1 Tax=Rouxiella aceris TaxID=2703884 RepID=A0A848MI56_9GAMM|nr:hypothetical protein [Rouxiella aceris]NMP26672.1 hypothetical protein [Rouxiella aceris]